MTGGNVSEGYPHHLAGDPAPPPVMPDRRALGMALKAHRKHLEANRDLLETAAPWRPARSLTQLFAEANAEAPDRHKASDGMLGDARHQAENGPNGPGSGSDHNPWVIYGGQGIVRAGDLTNDPVLDLPAAFERLRARAAAGQLPQVTGGGYAILAGRITAEDWSGWRAYKGADPHVSHGHVSVSLTEAQYDLTAPWGLFRSEQPAPTPPPPAPAGWTGPDLTGAGASLRGQAAGQPQGPQSNGPRVAALQVWLNRTYPAYSHLAADGWYGRQTAAVLAEFAHRSGVPESDGLNIGPRVAAQLARAGFGAVGAAAPPEPAPEAPPGPAEAADAARVTARDRVRGHLERRHRR
jgi:hypothetical protein